MSKIILHEPEIEKREVVDIGKCDVTVTRAGAMYNPNLTMDELCLLRSIIWEHYDDHEITSMIHSWMFCNKKPKKVRRFSDLLDAFRGSGIDISFKEDENETQDAVC